MKMNDLQRNKSIVREFYEMAFNARNPEEAAEKFLGSVYIQHNPAAANGREAFVTFAKGFIKAFPDLRFSIIRQIAEGDLVVQHSHLIRERGSRDMAVMDIFRIKDGKLVEHWDVLQEIPDKSANDNTVF